MAHITGKNNKICEMLGCEYPILLAGMGGIAGKELVAAVTNAGGFGTFGSALDVKNKGPEELLEELLSIKKMCNDRPFGVDILVHGGDGGVMKQLIEIFAKGGAKAFISGKGFPRPDVIKQFHEKDMVVASIAGKVSHAINAVKAGVDFIIVQGSEGGGHTGEVALSILLPQVVDAIKALGLQREVPVVAAGGICNGKQLAMSFLYGASAVWVGTRFMLTPEANTHIKYKEKLLKATSDDTTVTKCFTGARLRVLRNAYTDKFEKNPELLESNSALIAKRAWDDGCWKLHSGIKEGSDEKLDYDDNVQAYVVGQDIGMIDKLLPASEIIKEMMSTSSIILSSLHSVVQFSKIRNKMSIRTRICDMLGIDVPIMLAGMGGIANKELVAAVTNAGGFGTFGSAIDVKNKGPDELLQELLSIKKMCNNKPFGVDILVHGGEGGVMKQLIEVFAQGGAKAFISGKGFPRKDVIDQFHAKNMLVASIAGKVSHAVNAAKAGVDFVIVQGCEGGGHTGEITLPILLPQVVEGVKKINPACSVVAAGGIFDGRGLAAALALGAEGIWVGTRFMLTPEAKTHPKYKQKLLNASSDDTTVTKCFTGARLRVLKNQYTEKFETNPKLLESNSALIAKRAWDDGCWRLHGGDDSNYEDSVQAYVVGQNIGAIKTLQPAGDIVREMVDSAVEAIQRFNSDHKSKL